MTIFLERQKIRKRKRPLLKTIEKALISIVITAIGLALLYGTYTLIFTGPYFSANNIIIEGAHAQLTDEDIINTAELNLGSSIFLIDVNGIYKRLKAHPWIEHAAVRRKLPHTIWIYVEERTPAAVLSDEKGLYLVDKGAFVFKPLNEADPKSFPVITGISLNDANSVKSALDLISLWNDSEPGQMLGLAEVHLSEASGYSIITSRGPVEIFMGRDFSESTFDALSKYNSVFTRGTPKYILANDERKITVSYKKNFNGI